MSDAPEDRLVCPNCQHENAKGAQQCEECGSSLVITVPVPPSAPEKNALVKAEIKPDEAPALPPNTVTLLIAGQAEPVIIPIQPEILFGRSAPGEPQPTVDLSKYNGHMLGVSRNHAKMVATASGFTLEDLGSANGVEVNGRRIVGREVLAIGDRVLIGTQELVLRAGTRVRRALEQRRFAAETLSGVDAAAASVASLVALVTASPESRQRIATTLLDHLRRSLCLYESTLARGEQEALRARSRQHLREPWAIDERERLAADLEAARVRVESSRTQLAAAEKRTQLARESRGFFDKSFRLGESDLPTRLRIELEAVEAERQNARTRIELAAAISALRQAMGLLPEQK